jgi:hypothetical protein
MKILLPLALLALSAPSRADLLIYDVTGDLTSLNGSGALTFSLTSFGSPVNNVNATISSLLFNGGVYGFGSGDPASDVQRSGDTIQFGGSQTFRFYDIPVTSFGSGISFQISLFGPGVLGNATGDGWTFGVFAQDVEPGNFEFLEINIPPSGSPTVNSTQAFNATLIPEPATWATLAAGIGALLVYARRRR